MNIEERKVIELAIEWIEKQPEETPHSKYDLDTRYVVLRELEAALAQPETPYKIGQRIAKTGGGISHLWSAVSQDDEIAEAERGFKEALAQPEQDQDEVDIRSRLYQRIHELETQLAQPEQEPVAVVDVHEFYDNCANFSLLQKLPKGKHTLYTTPPQRKPLTDEQKKNIFLKFYGKHWAYTNQIKHVMEAIEAAHGIKE